MDGIIMNRVWYKTGLLEWQKEEKHKRWSNSVSGSNCLLAKQEDSNVHVPKKKVRGPDLYFFLICGVDINMERHQMWWVENLIQNEPCVLLATPLILFSSILSSTFPRDFHTKILYTLCVINVGSLTILASAYPTWVHGKVFILTAVYPDGRFVAVTTCRHL